MTISKLFFSGYRFGLAVFLFTSSGLVAVAQPSAGKPRTIVTTDGEIDDVDSFIRMLLYANEFQLEGLVYSSSMWHYKGDGNGTRFISDMEMTKKLYGEKTDLRWPGVRWMQDLIDAYEQVYPTLSTHAPGYPTATALRGLIKVGNIDFEGDMKTDTEGSDFIKQKLLDDNLQPIYLQVWGGTNTIARALQAIENQYKNTDQWPAIYQKVARKAVIYAILDQDATYRNYIAVRWPAITVYYNAHQFWCLAYAWKTAVHKTRHPLLEGTFMAKNIILNHGPLTKLYYSYGDGQKQPGDDEHTHGDSTKLATGQWGAFGKYDFISEGDSPAFLHLVDVGLGNLNNPAFGGWGGRLQQSKTNPSRWEDGETVADFNPQTQKMDLAYPQIRWLEALQHDFAARADWCVTDYAHANHPPIVRLKTPAMIAVKPRQTVQLNGFATDPDGNAVRYQWWQYREVGTYPGAIQIRNNTRSTAFFTAPADLQKGQTIHVILAVTDTGTPQLTRYQRVVITGQ